MVFPVSQAPGTAGSAALSAEAGGGLAVLGQALFQPLRRNQPAGSYAFPEATDPLYVLESKIGEGGMGVVYLATHALLRRKTALKMLLSDRVDPQTPVQRGRVTLDPLGQGPAPGA